MASTAAVASAAARARSSASITTTAFDDKSGRALLDAFNFPFRK